MEGHTPDEELDRDGQDSFPASDPPSHWPGADCPPPLGPATGRPVDSAARDRLDQAGVSDCKGGPSSAQCDS
jgi:hypothetical protein